MANGHVRYRYSVCMQAGPFMGTCTTAGRLPLGIATASLLILMREFKILCSASGSCGYYSTSFKFTLGLYTHVCRDPSSITSYLVSSIYHVLDWPEVKSKLESIPNRRSSRLNHRSSRPTGSMYTGCHILCDVCSLAHQGIRPVLSLS